MSGRKASRPAGVLGDGGGKCLEANPSLTDGNLIIQYHQSNVKRLIFPVGRGEERSESVDDLFARSSDMSQPDLVKLKDRVTSLCEAHKDQVIEHMQSVTRYDLMASALQRLLQQMLEERNGQH